MRSRLAALALLLVVTEFNRNPVAFASPPHESPRAAVWRQSTEEELKAVIPARAPVISERIETELRTASGITDNKGHIVAGVLLITAGYSANGKYSYFLLSQTSIKIADKVLAAGNYLIGWTRSENELFVTVSDATTGKPVAEVTATRNPEIKRVESFHISPPSGFSAIQLGRFSFPYSFPEKN